MATKILWLSDNTCEQMEMNPGEHKIMYANMLEYAHTVARPDTEIVLQFVERNASKTFSPWVAHQRAYLSVEIIERLRQAEADGFDAAFPGVCYCEFFLQEARQAVSIPVVGPAESAMIVAQLVGRKFGVVTVMPSLENSMEETIRRHRWEGRAISYKPVRGWNADVIGNCLEAYAGRPERLIADFEKQALESIKEGADVIICGCNPYGAALSKIGYNQVADTGVPVVTALASMIKITEALVDLKAATGLTKSESENGPYKSTSSELLQDMINHGVGVPEVRNPRVHGELEAV